MKDLQKCFLIALLIVFSPYPLWAFEVDGICYNIIKPCKWNVEGSIGEVEVSFNGDTDPYWRDGFYEGDIVIPDYVVDEGGYKYAVVAIGDQAFHGCPITSLFIPHTLRSIGEEGLLECQELVSVKVDENNPVFDSRDDCNAIIETATNTLVYGFNCSSIPSTVTEIGRNAFLYMSKMTSIEIPNSVKAIGYGAFSSCVSLQSVVLPDMLETIGDEAFFGCINLTTITIPQSVKNIGEDAFGLCPCISTVYSFIADPFDLQDDFWNSTIDPNPHWEDAVLYVPKNTKQLYLNASGWNAFHHIVEMEEGTTGIDDMELQPNTDEYIYNISGQRLQEATKGIRIINGRKVLVK